jgi:hypothetical protein
MGGVESEYLNNGGGKIKRSRKTMKLKQITELKITRRHVRT